MKFCVAKLQAKMRSILAAHRQEKGRRLSAMKRRTSYSVRVSLRDTKNRRAIAQRLVFNN